MNDDDNPTPATEFGEWLGAHLNPPAPPDETPTEAADPVDLDVFMNTPIDGGAPSASPATAFAAFIAKALNKKGA